MATPTPAPPAPVAALRGFSRFYTQRIGALEAGLLGSPLPLPAARVLYEIAHRQPITAAALAAALDLDPGYLSRMLAALGRQRLLRQQRSPQDRRQVRLALSPAGRRQFARLDRGANRQAAELLRPLTPGQQRQLAQSLQAAQALLGGEPTAVAASAPVRLRHPRPGDLGWVVHRQGALYAREYGWNTGFEALVAHIAADFLDHHDPRRERGWIAERNGEILGSVFLVRQSATVAKLRLLYVEPTARGQKLGRRLVAACLAFARRAGYRRVTLWTMSILVSARRIYEAAGFQLTQEEPTRSFGKRLTAQHWDLALPARR
ncbi:MAG TPA: bifunctional helix-turn-helix transcriptional regulator/GNAT family N-acetyltransferase [Terriglobales bacterium]|nr:bifunctional helix-turn-helix transcriptional regulator/GNAT family N-acetyltransferase [Terriglobales bacterium]